MRRRLEERLGAEVRFERIPVNDATLEEFMAMEAAGWKGKAGTAFAAVPGHAAFFREVCRAFARRDRLELWAMRCGDQTLAMTTMITRGRFRFAFRRRTTSASGASHPEPS